jgi:hypothetical protein
VGHTVERLWSERKTKYLSFFSGSCYERETKIVMFGNSPTFEVGDDVKSSSKYPYAGKPGNRVSETEPRLRVLSGDLSPDTN